LPKEDAGATDAVGMTALRVPLLVTLIGAESTGKTTLARALAEEWGEPWVPEYARTYVGERRAPLTAGDVEPIARGQIAGEDEGRSRARRLLILDTDLVSTVVYARHYYGSCPAWIEEAAAARRADLYLLHHPDVPWVPDGDSRDRPSNRDEMHALFREALDGLGACAVDVRGSWDERQRTAREAIARALQGLSPAF
jgi:NadR type nicotinamide-nucleotide adenylyltransferase